MHYLFLQLYFLGNYSMDEQQMSIAFHSRKVSWRKLLNARQDDGNYTLGILSE